MTNTELKNKLESSFSPYRCLVQLDAQNYALTFGFQISDPKNTIISSRRGIKTSMVNSDEILSELITEIKIEIRSKGYHIS